mgnify:FL=1
MRAPFSLPPLSPNWPPPAQRMEYSAPGIRSFLDGAADLRLSLEADTSEERGLLSKHASSIQAAKDGQRLLKGFYAYSIASEVSSRGWRGGAWELSSDARRCSRLLGVSALCLLDESKLTR